MSLSSVSASFEKSPKPIYPRHKQHPAAVGEVQRAYTQVEDEDPHAGTSLPSEFMKEAEHGFLLDALGTHADLATYAEKKENWSEARKHLRDAVDFLRGFTDVRIPVVYGRLRLRLAMVTINDLRKDPVDGWNPEQEGIKHLVLGKKHASNLIDYLDLRVGKACDDEGRQNLLSDLREDALSTMVCLSHYHAYLTTLRVHQLKNEEAIRERRNLELGVISNSKIELDANGMPKKTKIEEAASEQQRSLEQFKSIMDRAVRDLPPGHPVTQLEV